MTENSPTQPGPENRASQGAAEMAGPAFQVALPADAADKMSRALGHAVARCWSRLSQEAQHDLFEAAAGARRDAVRCRHHSDPP